MRAYVRVRLPDCRSNCRDRAPTSVDVPPQVTVEFEGPLTWGQIITGVCAEGDKPASAMRQANYINVSVSRHLASHSNRNSNIGFPA
jgi:hypothetical protein